MSSASTLVSPSMRYIDEAKLIKQGAEAKVYVHPSFFPTPTVYYPPKFPHPISTSYPPPPTPVIFKHRFQKTYRHPELDRSLTRTRLQFEARALARCARYGVIAPCVLLVDENAGVLGIEFIEGWSVREILGGGAEGEVEVDAGEEEEREPGDTNVVPQVEELVQYETEGMRALHRIGVTDEHLMSSMGAALARLHNTNIIHGDLTTSNMMVRLTPNGDEPYEIVLIDFGLSSTATMPENYAVDLYVLERAFASTHPASEKLYAKVLEAYAAGLGKRKWKPIETKLQEVRLRGRKRDMTG